MKDTPLDLNALQRAVDGLRSQQESVQRERVELQSMKATVEENLSQFKQRVKLNVGGKKFETTLTTLTTYPDSMLGAMFSGRHEVPPDEEGCVFIDRDGKHFGTILNFLRTGTLDMPSSTKAVSELKREMEYYQLPGMEAVTDAPDAPVVEIVETTSQALRAAQMQIAQQCTGSFGHYDAESGPMHLRSVANLHQDKLQKKLQANTHLRIVAQSTDCHQCKSINMITTLATQHSPLPTALIEGSKGQDGCLVM